MTELRVALRVLRDVRVAIAVDFDELIAALGKAETRGLRDVAGYAASHPHEVLGSVRALAFRLRQFKLEYDRIDWPAPPSAEADASDGSISGPPGEKPESPDAQTGVRALARFTSQGEEIRLEDL